MLEEKESVIVVESEVVENDDKVEEAALAVTIRLLRPLEDAEENINS